MNLFDRWLTQINESLDFSLNVDWHREAEKELGKLAAAAADDHSLAITGGKPKDVIADAKWLYEIAAASKECNAIWLERPPKEVISQHKQRVKELKREHFEWCSKPRDAKRRLERYERYWSHYHSQTEGRAELFHGDFIRTCA